MASVQGVQRAPGIMNLSRRTLLIALVAIGLAAGALIFLKGSNSSRSAAVVIKPPAVALGATAHARAVPTLTAHQRDLVAQRLQAAAYIKPMLPVLDSAARLFDQSAVTAALVGPKDLGGLALGCSSNEQRVATAFSQVVGMPHAFSDRSLAGKLRLTMNRVYGDELSAMDQCNVAGDSRDAGQAAHSIALLAYNARTLHRVAREAHALAP